MFINLVVIPSLILIVPSLPFMLSLFIRNRILKIVAIIVVGLFFIFTATIVFIPQLGQIPFLVVFAKCTPAYGVTLFLFGLEVASGIYNLKKNSQ